jgi:hypothetical protein
VRQFNLMFSTQVGSVAEDSTVIYLRPETAQGIFVNFLNVQKSGRMKIPFGIAQIGKAFRNEIVARQFTFRMREFEQMEMQFFVRPGTEMEWYEKWRDTRLKFHQAVGLPAEKLKFHIHEKLAHYANAAVDIEYQFPFGFREIEGIHSRTDFDLRSHQEHSGKKLQYFDPETNSNFIPYVVETSIGLDRMFLLLLCNAYREELVGEADKQETRVVLALPPQLAPVKVAIFPLTKKDGLPEKAREIAREIATALGASFRVYDWKSSNSGIFQAVIVQRNVMFLILTLIILVASFNIISSLIMLVREKGRDVAILRTMGASRASIMRIFFACGAGIGVMGTIVGVALGLLIAFNTENIQLWLESMMGHKLFADELYFLSHLPSKVEMSEVVTVVAMSLGLSFLATLYPARRAAKLDPAEALRYE